MAKVSKEMELNLSEELNMWGARVVNKIRRNFQQLYISSPQVRKNPKRFTQRLYRSVFWTVHNAAGGNKAMIEFFYLRYGQYVEMGVGGETKAWDVPQITGKNFKPMANPQTKRKAKPFFRSELRFHQRWLQERLLQQYMFMGNLYVVRGFYENLQSDAETQKWIEAHRKELEGANFYFL